jgi:hypothetical protein
MVAAMPYLPPGSRVLVTWHDGRVHPATLCAFAQGLAQVRWDGGAASAWVPLANLRPLLDAAPAATPPSVPAPSGWAAYPAYSGARPAPTPGQAPRALSPTLTMEPTAPAATASLLPPSGSAGGVSPLATPSAPPQPAAAGVASSPPAAKIAPFFPIGTGLPSSSPAASASSSPRPDIASMPPSAVSATPVRPMGAMVGGLPRGLVYEPTRTGPGSGQAFFIFFGFVTSADGDAAMRMTDIEHLGDDVAALQAAGYRVVVDLHGDLEGLNAALAGTHPDAAGAPAAGIFWDSNGDDDGTIEDYEGYRIAPDQIAPEAARRGSCKLFVMSTCCTGPQCERWQKAIGPQTAVVAWGTPVTNDRAIDFLTPDEASTRDFDDLLARHLGVERVRGDGPLAEVRELARRHEDKLATLLLTFDELIEASHKRLGCPLQRGKGGDAYFTVKAPPSKERPDVARAQVVRVAPVGLSDSFLLVSSLVGPYTEALDLARGLRTIAPALHLRLTIARISPPEQDFVVVETLFRRRRLDPITLARNVNAVGAYADRLEDLFFGSDQR